MVVDFSAKLHLAEKNRKRITVKRRFYTMNCMKPAF